MKNFFRPIFDVDEEICPRGQRAPRPNRTGNFETLPLAFLLMVSRR
jgi:hypothetical protein